MKITIESTTKIVKVISRDATHNNSLSRPGWNRPPGVRNETAIECRVWEGVTETGIRVQCLIPRIATFAANDQEQFIRELEAKKPPTAELNAFPLRMVL